MDADPGPATNLVLQIALLVVLVLINAFFTMSETAIVALNDSKVKKMAEDGNKKAKKVMKLTESSTTFLSTIQIGVTLTDFLIAVATSYVFVGKVTKDTNKCHFTEKESDEGAKILWATPKEGLELITNCFDKIIGSKYENVYQTKFIVYRDKNILQYYVNLLEKHMSF